MDMYAYCSENNKQVGLGCDQAQSMRKPSNCCTLIDITLTLTLTEIKGIFKETLTPEDCLYNGGVCM